MCRPTRIPAYNPPLRILMLNCPSPFARLILVCIIAIAPTMALADQGAEFFERRIRPILVDHCYECHSEAEGERQGGLLLDRQSGWLEGGDTNKAIIPGHPDASLLITAIRYDDEDLQMPPDGALSPEQIELLEQWVRLGAPAPEDDIGETDFSRRSDMAARMYEALYHWSFQPITAKKPPRVTDSLWNHNPIDQFVYDRLADKRMTPSPAADSRTLIRRLYYDTIGLPPTSEDVRRFAESHAKDPGLAVRQEVERLLHSPSFGQHIGRMWLDVVRYADTDSAYRPDTKTPHYFPFAFTYRDYVVDSFNQDKPFDQFIKEQMAADLLGHDRSSPEMAALGFYAVGPHANRSQLEALDDWIDVTTRGLMGVTVACARCHDHKFEPIPTEDYYSLRGVFAAITRINPLDETRQPLIEGYEVSEIDKADYQERRRQIDAKVNAAQGKKAKNNNRSLSQKIRETELAELLLQHPGAPVRAMVVVEKKRPPIAYVHVRGDPGARGDQVPRAFLRILDSEQTEFTADNSGRLDLAARIVAPDNPLTPRVLVNRVWGHLMGSHLVRTPSDFGFEGIPPTHPKLLDWLAADFVRHDWSVKRLVRQILLSKTYAQAADHREAMAAIDPENLLLWRANRQHLSIEAIRDSVLAVSGRLDREHRGRAGRLWDDDYTPRRAIYGFINRFNLDPTLRAFDFPSPMQTHPDRGESIVAPQALFAMNSPFVIEQAKAIIQSARFAACQSDQQRVACLFQMTFQRDPDAAEVQRVLKYVEFQKRFKKVPRFDDSAWPLIAQSLLMSNEFQYVD